ncbi:MAG: alpha/beta fold hydrolase [Henriciella sp.]
MDLELISRTNEARPDRPRLLFVHGGFHGAWCWDEHFLDWFSARGWAAHAVSLRGHGASEGHDQIRQFSMSDYCEDVLSAIDRVGGQVVLIGHSMGGVVSQMCMTKSNTIAGMVLLASSPRRPSLRVALRLLRAHPVSLLLGQALKDPVRLRRAMIPFFLSPKLAPSLRELYHSRLSLESPMAMGELFSRDAPIVSSDDTRPVHVIAGADDWSIPVAEHKTLASAYNATLDICPGWHDLMLDPDWQKSAGSIDRWLIRNFD